MVCENLINVINWVKWLFTRAPGDGASTLVEKYCDGDVAACTFWLTSFIAAILSFGSIMILARILSTEHHLAAVGGCNCLVVVCLMCFSDASRRDFFFILPV